MIAFPGMLIPAAKEAGIAVPHDPDNFDASEYPYFAVFCNVQLGRSMRPMNCHWDNAKIIASIPSDRIKEITFGEILAMGYQ